MTTKRLTERFRLTGRVNRESGTITGVLLCGTTSANGRDYPTSVFKRDYRKYEGRPVNCDHGREATVDRRFGWFSDVRVGEDGRPRGTLNCLKSHPMYERVMEAAERNPALFGFSHVAMCRTKPGAGGREVVEAIESVESVDLVAEPATTMSLFEQTTSRGQSMSTLRILITAILRRDKVKESVRRRTRMLQELLGDAPAGTLDNPAPDATGNDDSDLKQAFRSAVDAVIDKIFAGKLDYAEGLKQVTRIFKTHDSVSGETINADDNAELGTSESRRLGPPPTDPAEFARYLEVTPAFTQRFTPSGTAPSASTALTEAERQRLLAEGKPPSDPKEFARWANCQVPSADAEAFARRYRD